MKDAPEVLMVDDNHDHVELVERSLRTHFRSLKFWKAYSAAESLEVIPEIKLDLVILDYQLPEQDGVEVLKAIRKIDPHLPVMMLTGQGDELVAVEAMKQGANDYVIKSDGYLTLLPSTVSRILKESENRLRRDTLELYYRDLVENSPDGIYLLDEAGNIRLVNRICVQMSGYNKRKLIGSHFSLLFEEREYKKLLCKLRKNQRFKRIMQFQTHILCKSGRKIPVELSVIPVKRQGTIIGYQGIAQDISERLRMEEEKLRRTRKIQRMNLELLEKNKKLQELHELKSQFVSNVGHELRTPLNGILGYAELLKEGIYGSLTPDQMKAITHIITSGNHLLNLINELLDFAKIQSGKFKIYQEYASVYDIVEAASSTVGPSVQNKRLQFIRSVEQNLPKIFVDPQKIYQVLLNILSNAVKFTEQGEIELKVFRDEEAIHFSVRDTGIGIPAEEIDTIFLDFHQADGSSTRNYGGTGLGLSLAKYLVEVHQGEIWVESTPGVGSTFRFKIPIGEEREGDPLQEKRLMSKRAERG